MLRSAGRTALAFSLGVLALLPKYVEARAIIVGDSYTVGYDVAGHSDISGSVDLLVTAFTSSSIGLSLVVKNSSTLAGARLVSVGWKTDAAATGGSETSSTFALDVSSPNFPSHSQVNTCLYAGSNCAGGGSGGLNPLTQESFTVTLTGNWGLTPAADFSLFAAKFQTGIGSFEPDGVIRIAEPATLGLFLFGIASMAMLRARRSGAPS